MAAATADRVGNSVKRQAPRGFRTPVALKSGIRFYKNTLIGIDPADGFAEPVDGSTAYSQVYFLSASIDTTDDASDGDTVTDAAWLGVVVELEAAGLAITDNGVVCYADDDQTIVTSQGGTEPEIGRIVNVVSATKAEVFISPENGA